MTCVCVCVCVCVSKIALLQLLLTHHYYYSLSRYSSASSRGSGSRGSSRSVSIGSSSSISSAPLRRAAASLQHPTAQEYEQPVTSSTSTYFIVKPQVLHWRLSLAHAHSDPPTCAWAQHTTHTLLPTVRGDRRYGATAILLHWQKGMPHSNATHAYRGMRRNCTQRRWSF